MKTAIIGTPLFEDYQILKWHLNQLSISEILIFGDWAIDTLARKYSEEKRIPLKFSKPETGIEGYFPLLKRNFLLAESCDALVVFWDGKSSATASIIKKAREKGKEVMVVQSFI